MPDGDLADALSASAAANLSKAPQSGERSISQSRPVSTFQTRSESSESSPSPCSQSGFADSRCISIGFSSVPPLGFARPRSGARMAVVPRMSGSSRKLVPGPPLFPARAGLLPNRQDWARQREDQGQTWRHISCPLPSRHSKVPPLPVPYSQGKSYLEGPA